jgi:catechol 2,3-dioxygenase-like lactoylglutathione lyase family enzyme
MGIVNIMEDTPLDSVHHFAQVVVDLEQTLRWYETSFRCEVIHREQGSVVLRFENVLLTLILPSHQPPHIAFSRHDAASFGLLHKNLDGTKSVFVADPSGNAIELVSSV